ncbi:hypothetical protein B0H19DRAFT_1080382 [Mycena capillaripes]|nr:hypothetical protein B0H19DRAFT_1080382 [Mycena capillaripes]
MFSKIFTFGLAALSFVAAAPATGFNPPMAISCSVNVPVETYDVCRHEWLIGARSGEPALLRTRNAPKDGTRNNLGSAIRVARPLSQIRLILTGPAFASQHLTDTPRVPQSPHRKS